MPSSTHSRARKRPLTEEAADPIHRLLCGRVRELRKKRGWTLEQLSAACGVSRSMLSEIERGNANPTLAVAFRIAGAFSMSLGDLVEAPAAPSRIDVIRADDRAYHYRSDKHVRIRTLSPLRLEKSVEYYEVTLSTGGALTSSPHFEGARELLTVQQGGVRVKSDGETIDLSRGDSAHYPADVPHSIKNTSREDAIVFLVVTYSRD
ncbi:MAG: transcriptional regulator, family [Phycisphaerales bacterium]|nr:transcriptional regulator, family [Phycisphaerales bacterium]